jgi:hypothetical protein
MPPGVGRKEREKREGRGESRFLYNTYYMAMYFINSQQADGSLAGWMDGYSNIGESERGNAIWDGPRLRATDAKKLLPWDCTFLLATFKRLTKHYITRIQKEIFLIRQRISLSRVKRFGKLYLHLAYFHLFSAARITPWLNLLNTCAAV